MVTFAAIGSFFVFLAVIILLRVKFGKTFELKASDLFIALSPLVIWLIFSGQIRELAVGDTKIVFAVEVAAKSPTSYQEIETRPILVEPPAKMLPKTDYRKGTINILDSYIKAKVQALTLVLGKYHYAGLLIKEYLRELTHFPYLQYIVINDEDGTFFGMADAREIASILEKDMDKYFNATTLANWLNEGDKKALATLPGFISAENALSKGTDSRTALEQINMLDFQALPVVDENRKYLGVTERSKLVASIIIDIIKFLEIRK